MFYVGKGATGMSLPEECNPAGTWLSSDRVNLSSLQLCFVVVPEVQSGKKYHPMASKGKKL